MMRESTSSYPLATEGSGIGLAAVGGGGAGTLLVGLAQLLPETSQLKTLLVLAAPSISAALGYFWIQATAWFRTERKERIADEKTEELRDYLISQINSENTLPDMKAQYKRQLALLEEKRFQRVIRVIDS